MCGVLGFWSEGAPPSSARLEEALAALERRGPDGAGWFRADGGRLVLGHRRLALVDIAHGQQPLTSAAGDLACVVNGELYDDGTLERELTSRGHVFRTRSDSELVLHAYAEWGLECFGRLRGEFAVLIWDGTQRRLVAARDRFGIKPLCFARLPRGVALASQVKALFRLGVERAWDAESFYQVATLQYVPCGRTLFRGVEEVQPGHFLVVEAGRVSERRYWDLDFPEQAEPDRASGQSDTERAARLLEELTAAVRLRLRGDVPVVCHLSGGVDSSLVAALAAQECVGPLPCFTLGFDDGRYDETALAAETSRRLGAALHVVEVRRSALMEHLSDAVFHAEGLTINGHLSAKYLLNRAIRDAGYGVALTGEGADEALAGYPHFQQDALELAAGSAEPEERVAALRADHGAALRAQHGASLGIMLPTGPSLSLEVVRARLGFVPTFLRAKAGFGLRQHALLRPEFREAYHPDDCFTRLLTAVRYREQLLGRHPVDQARHLWIKLALAGYILRTLGDGTEMAHAVEGRLPYLDHRFFEYARTLSPDPSLASGLTKRLLRRAAEPLLPRAVLQRPKHPLLAPPFVTAEGDGAAVGFVQDVLRGPALERVPFYDRGLVLATLERLPALSADERAAWDPVLTSVVSAALLAERLRL